MLYRKIIPIIVLLFSISIVQAIGITPAIRDIQPINQVVEYSIYSKEDQPFNAGLELEGDLLEFIELHQDKVRVESELTPFQLSTNFPNDLEPGLYTTNIVVMKIPDDQTSGINSYESVVGILQTRVPYPGQFIEASLSIIPDQSGADISIPLFNRGSIDSNPQVTVSVDDETIYSDIVLVGPQAQDTIDVRFNGKKGTHDVRTTIQYTDSIELLDSFDIGAPNFEVIDINPKDLPKGKIARIKAIIDSDWNQNLNTQITVKQTNQIFEHIISPGINEIDLIIETQNFNVGSHGLTISTQYSQEKSFTVNIIETKSKFPLVIGILLLLIIFLLYFIQKNKPKGI